MPRPLLLCALLAAGCVVNHAELEAQQAALDLELAMSMAKADQLNTLRREAEAAELALQEGFKEFPELEADWKAAEANALPVVATRPPLALPPESLFEGSTGARLRARLADTDARLRMLDKVLAEVTRIEQHQRRVRRQLDAIDKAKAVRAK